MVKKILFVSLVVLFSTTLIPKEKVFLDYGFLKDISGRIDKACELNEKGKTVKAEKLLKEIDQEMTNYLSKLGSFYLSKECPIAWTNSSYSGSLECLHQINIAWAFGDIISKKVLEQMESFTEDKDDIVFIDGKFKLHYEKIGKSYYNSFRGEIKCFSTDKIQKIDIYAIPVSIQVSKKEWSGFFSEMSWNDAKAKCSNIGMRLPTIDELRFAPRLKWGKDAQRKSEKESGNNDIDESLISDMDLETYWSSKEIGDKAYWVTGFGPGVSGDEIGNELKTNTNSVRCIR